MDYNTLLAREEDFEKDNPITLKSPQNPTPTETLFLSNIDQTVAFPVETIYFYEALPGMEDVFVQVLERVKRSISDLLLIPYYFMAGRLNFNFETKRLEVLCNNAGALLVAARTRLRLEDLGDVSLPNPSFQHLLLRTDVFGNLDQTPLLTIQITGFKCGGFSIGFSTNHSILDGKSAHDFFANLASICRGEGLKTQALCNDRRCFRAREPPQIKYPHEEYTKFSSLNTSSFTSPNSNSSPLSKLQERHSYKLFSFTPQMLQTLKIRAAVQCSTFEIIVAQIWRARARAVFEDPTATSSVLFAVDFRSRLSPAAPAGFIGNAVITACATAKVGNLEEKPLCFSVGKVKEAIGRVTDEYVRSVIDWLEVYKGVPSCGKNGNFYVSAWWKLPFHELDLGWGNPIYGGPVVSGMDEFVLLLSDHGRKTEEGGGINVWIALEKEKMEKFSSHLFQIM